jgi:hypothetical protein
MQLLYCVQHYNFLGMVYNVLIQSSSIGYGPSCHLPEDGSRADFRNVVVWCLYIGYMMDKVQEKNTVTSPCAYTRTGTINTLAPNIFYLYKHFHLIRCLISAARKCRGVVALVQKTALLPQYSNNFAVPYVPAAKRYEACTESKDTSRVGR